jgi:nicotinamidase-related amidase
MTRQITMAPPNSALFVIDIQHDLAGDPKTEIPHAARIRDAGEVILSAARGISQTEGAQPPLIVFVQHEEAPEEGPLVKGSDPWKLVFEPQTNNSREILVPKTTRMAHGISLCEFDIDEAQETRSSQTRDSLNS